MSTGNQQWDDAILELRKALMHLEIAFKENFSDAKPEVTAEAISGVHLIKTDASGIFDYCSRIAVEALGSIPEVILSDGTKVEKRGGSERKKWDHDGLAKNVASRLNDMAIDMSTGEVVMTPQDMITKVLDYAAVSYWRVRELSKIGISADNFCEVTESEPTIIIRRAK
jgi:hypothetical protein